MVDRSFLTYIAFFSRKGNVSISFGVRGAFPRFRQRLTSLLSTLRLRVVFVSRRTALQTFTDGTACLMCSSQLRGVSGCASKLRCTLHGLDGHVLAFCQHTMCRRARQPTSSTPCTTVSGSRTWCGSRLFDRIRSRRLRGGLFPIFI